MWSSNTWQPHSLECWHWLLPIVAAVCVLCGFISGATWHHYMGGEQHSNCVCMASVSNSVALVFCAELLVMSCFNECAAIEMVLCFCVWSTGLITKEAALATHGSHGFWTAASVCAYCFCCVWSSWLITCADDLEHM